MMPFETSLQQAAFVLTEGSVYERLRRHPAVDFDPYLAHAGLLYETSAADVLAQVHRQYLDIGQQYNLPMVALTDTWRASRERIDRSRFKGRAVNQDNARFLCAMREGYGQEAAPLFIAGLMGCRGDAYRPEEALSKDAAAAFHAYQAQALAETDVDFLMAATLPAFSEAHGMATAMAATGRPYVLSFVLRRDGALLDGTLLRHVIEEIDATVARPPTGYFVNCVHPTVLHAALIAGEIEERGLLDRLIGFQANTSARSPEELVHLEELETEEPTTFAASMLQIHQRFDIPILGGCCGTDTRHIERLAGLYSMKARSQQGT